MPAAAAAVNDRPFSAFPHPDPDRVHDAAASGRAVAGNVVQMQASQAIGTVVAVFGSGTVRRDQISADLTGKGSLVRVFPGIIFFQGNSS